MGKIINIIKNNSNRKGKTPQNRNNNCNFRNKYNCPLNNKCLTNNLI